MEKARVLPYRPCVVAVFVDANVQPNPNLLVGFRDAHQIWQFPQGGIEPGETPREALYREMFEELACRDFDIIKEHPDWLYYDFPASLKAPISEQFCGQQQRWFLCAFHPNKSADLAAAVDQEFQALQWADAVWILGQATPWKRPVYEAALTGFGLI